MEVKDAIMALERLRHTEAKWPGTEDTLEALDMAVVALRFAPSPEQLRGACWACGHAEPYANRPMESGIVTCPYMRERGIAARGGRGGKDCPHWTLCQEERHDPGDITKGGMPCAWCGAEYTIIDDDFAQPVHPNMVKFCWHCGRPLEKKG